MQPHALPICVCHAAGGMHLLTAAEAAATGPGSMSQGLHNPHAYNTTARRAALLAPVLLPNCRPSRPSWLLMYVRGMDKLYVTLNQHKAAPFRLLACGSLLSRLGQHTSEQPGTHAALAGNTIMCHS